jgi:predicted DNA binding protein
MRDRDRELTDALGRPGSSPCSRSGTTPGTIQDALDAAPAAVVDGREVGSYHARRIGGRSDLTDRQTEAVGAPVELGYYENPRAASVADVGEAIGCSPGTAAEHLRRAERTVMAGAVPDRS